MEMSKKEISKTKETAVWNCSVCKIDVHLYPEVLGISLLDIKN
jgi:hypothetical protein